MVSTEQTARGTLSVEVLNRHLREYGESVRHFFRDQQRSAMVSPLFNLPGRLILGSYCYYENMRPLLSELLRHASAEEIGKGMRKVCSRANSIHLNSLLLGYFNGREQARLLGQAKPDDVDEIALLLDFWARASSAYRSDGHRLPDDASFAMPILMDKDVSLLTQHLREELSESAQHKIRRMMATLELYTFILNGEARIGIFHHGPYPLDNGDVLLVKEWIGLRDQFYPWSTTGSRPAWDAVARVMRLRGVQVKIVLMGSLTTFPKSYEEHVVSQGVLGIKENQAIPLSPSDIEAITAVAGEAQLELYRRMIDWDDRYRVEYGAELYGCIFHTFAEQLQLAGFAERIRKAFRPSIERHADNLFSGREAPVVLSHIAKTEGPIYAPIFTP